MDAERLAAAVNELAGAVTGARRLLTDECLVTLLVWQTGLSRTTVSSVLAAIEHMPARMLTPAGRAIRLRDDT